jgi:hypothetical protein
MVSQAGAIKSHPVYFHMINKIAPGVFQSRPDSGTGDSSDDSDTYSSKANDNTDTDWTWPNNKDNNAWMIENFNEDTYNGYKPFHQSSAAFFVQDVGWPTYDAQGNFLAWKQLPSLSDIANAVWNLLDKTTQQNIKNWVATWTSDSGKSIADAIYEVVKMALKNLGVPPFVIRVILGVIVPRLITWIAANIDSLTVKSS